MRQGNERVHYFADMNNRSVATFLRAYSPRFENRPDILSSITIFYVQDTTSIAVFFYLCSRKK